MKNIFNFILWISKQNRLTCSKLTLLYSFSFIIYTVVLLKKFAKEKEILQAKQMKHFDI